MGNAYDDLLRALEVYNEDARPEVGERLIHQAVQSLVRPLIGKLHNKSDFEDVCQEVEIAIAQKMAQQRRKVVEVVMQVPIIIDRKIIDANGRSEISQKTFLARDDRQWEKIMRDWERIRSVARSFDDEISDAEVRHLLSNLDSLTTRDKVALQAMCDGQDAEGIRLALERHVGRPVKANAAKQAFLRARRRLKKITGGGNL